MHGSTFIAVVGQHDCTGNAKNRNEQEQQIDAALEYLKNAYGDGILYVGLYVNENWEVE